MRKDPIEVFNRKNLMQNKNATGTQSSMQKKVATINISRYMAISSNASGTIGPVQFSEEKSLNASVELGGFQNFIQHGFPGILKVKTEYKEKKTIIKG